MPVLRIEKIDVRGGVVQRVEADATGKYHCLPFGNNVETFLFNTLEEVATFLRTHAKAGVRMNPGWSKISRRIYIDGAPL